MESPSLHGADPSLQSHTVTHARLLTPAAVQDGCLQRSLALAAKDALHRNYWFPNTGGAALTV